MPLGVRAEALTRIASSHDFLRMIDAHEQRLGASDAASRAGKGMLFVQNYATYEFVVVRLVRAMNIEANRLAIPMASVRVELLAMALNPEFDSLIQGSLQKTWTSRISMLKRTRDTAALSIHEMLFPKDGSHFRLRQLETIWQIFGLPASPLPQMRLNGILDEMVAKRNSIAHGEESAEDVGRRFTVPEMRSRINDTDAICSHLIATVVSYLAAPNAFK